MRYTALGVMEEMVRLKQGDTKLRWRTANKDEAFDALRYRSLLETRPEDFLRALESGTVSTNV